ncbi:MAG TPA: thioredoxin domain-containing protein [Solirubrobacteraceae bacterium]|nr:thioredoxin domain-containing protein [Solirubrobacteraceae bacterium]
MSNRGAEDDEQDLTRKQRREQARTQRKALEEEQAASAKRRARLTQLGIVGAVVVVAVVVILLATGGGSGKAPAKSGSKAANENVAVVSSLIGGIPQHGNVLGDPNAPITLQYYGDLECPICREFTLGAFPEIVQKWVKTGKVKVEYHSMETATREPEVFKTQQIAAYAAGKQNLGWYYIELFYHEQGEEDSGYVTESYLQNLAQQVPGLHLETWTADRSDPELANQVEADKQTANNEGFTGTPSFLLGKTGAKPEKVTELSDADLQEASALFNPKIEALLKS